MRSYRLTDYDIAMFCSSMVFEAVLTAQISKGQLNDSENIELAKQIAKVSREMTPEALHRKFQHHEVKFETQEC